MSNLIKTQSNSQIGNARASKKVNDCTLEDVKTKLKYIFKLIGLVKIPDEVERDILIDFIKNDMKQFRIEEFALAFKMMVRGDFEIKTDHFQNFSVKYLCGVMNAYSKCDKRKKHLQEQKLKELPMSARLSDSEKQKIVEDGIKIAYDRYKKTGEMPYSSSQTYLAIEDLNGHMHTAQEKMQFLTLAHDSEKERLQELKRVSFQDALKKVVGEIQDLEKVDKLIPIARKIALKAYWDEMKISEQL